MHNMKRNSKLRMIFYLVAITALIAAFAGCGNNAGGSAPAGSAPGSAGSGSAAPGSSGSAAGGSSAVDEAPGSVHIGVYAQNPASGDPGFLIYEPGAVVAPGLAGGYGFEYDPSVDPIKDVTALDAAVFITELFTTQTGDAVPDMLAVNSGFIGKAFGVESMNWMTFVNGAAPNDGVLTDYGYTGLASNQIILHDGDFVNLYCQKLSDYDKGTSDDIAWFALASDTSGAPAALPAAKVGEPLELRLVGYPMLNIFAKEDARGEGSIAGAQVALLKPGQPIPGQNVDADGGIVPYAPFVDPPLATTDANGAVSLTFDKPGVYPISAYYAQSEARAVMVPPLIVTVK